MPLKFKTQPDLPFYGFDSLEAESLTRASYLPSMVSSLRPAIQSVGCRTGSMPTRRRARRMKSTSTVSINSGPAAYRVWRK